LEQRDARAGDWDDSERTMQRKPLDDAPDRSQQVIGHSRTSLDKEMLSNGTDIGKLVDMTEARNELEEQEMDSIWKMEELEALLEQIELLKEENSVYVELVPKVKVVLTTR
jgi:hypothetical protein